MNMITRLINYPWRLKITTLLFRQWRFASCGKKILIGKPLKISYKHIRLSNNIYIWKNCRIEAITLYSGTIYTPLITIGNNVSIQQNLHLTCAKSITIGNETAIGANVTITDINHTYTDTDIPPEKQPLEVIPVKIGDDCKIYNNTVILPGTVLGKHCIVGANSVVCGIFNDYSVIVGSPGKIVKQYNNHTRQWEKTY